MDQIRRCLRRGALTGKGRVTRKRDDIVEEEVERQPNARFPPKVQ